MSPAPSMRQRVAAAEALVGRVRDITGQLPDYAAALALGHAGNQLAAGRCVVLRQTAGGLRLEICARRSPAKWAADNLASIPPPTEVPPS